MYNRLKSCIKHNKLLYKAQCGFREKFSTQHAILDMMNVYISRFSPFKKAFDTVNHTILLDKLDHNDYGIRGIVHE